MRNKPCFEQHFTIGLFIVLTLTLIQHAHKQTCREEARKLLITFVLPFRAISYPRNRSTNPEFKCMPQYLLKVVRTNSYCLM